MQDNDFSKLLDEKIASLSERKRAIQQNLLNGDWHMNEAQKALNTALDNLEALCQEQDVDVEKELLSLLNQVPRLVKSIWASGVQQADAVEEEISRWKEMGAYYSQFVENKKQEEQRKKEAELRKKKEEVGEQEMIEAITSGELKEPTRMDQIRRQTGERPPPRIGRFRKLAAKANNEETTDADDSRG